MTTTNGGEKKEKGMGEYHLRINPDRVAGVSNHGRVKNLIVRSTCPIPKIQANEMAGEMEKERNLVHGYRKNVKLRSSVDYLA